MWLKLGVLSLLVAGIAAFFAFDVGAYFTLEGIKAEQATLEAWLAARPLLTFGGFFGVYVLVTALSLPAAAVLTLLAGALFGFGWGVLLVSVASTTGATLAMLAARLMLRESLQGKYGTQLRGINAGFAREGAFYLFALRLVPAMPFFMVNLLMGLLPMKVRTFWWVSQLGMLPGTAVFVYAGTALAGIERLGDLVSPPLLVAFTLLGVLPLVAKRGLAVYRKTYAKKAEPDAV
jgi:uncharacterized membrane protein YdjX (TVP38/TMEM64 family)